jgi:site-specific recombinase XerC
VAVSIEANPYDGRHSYASLLIHSGRSPLAVAAAMGHASAETTWKHYAHLFEEAQLASSSDPDEAIWRARREVSEESSVRPLCDEEPGRHRRLVG